MSIIQNKVCNFAHNNIFAASALVVGAGLVAQAPVHIQLFIA